jgi:predicted type IV restriction endonuclease
MQNSDWGEASVRFDDIAAFAKGRDLSTANEAQTRFDFIDRVIKDVLGWQHGQISVEEPSEAERTEYVDYLLRVGDYVVVVEAKRGGAAFPTPTRKTRLKLGGSVLGSGEIGKAISQAEGYGISKQADVVVVTNGACWCFFSMKDLGADTWAHLLFPLTQPAHAEQLFNFFAVSSVEDGSLEQITNRLPRIENRLLSLLEDADARIDRNNIADYIGPALNNALYADALLNSPQPLERCFVPTEARHKFDRSLGIHLADSKPTLVAPARRIKTAKRKGGLHDAVETASAASYAPPVTLLIGPVGAGKSTYLKHFELVAGKQTLHEKKVHWIYIDFEQMGREGSPRTFIYRQVRDYLLAEHPVTPTDYRTAVEPAYRDEVAGMARGPFAPIAGHPDEFQKVVGDLIRKDFEAVEPYVDKVTRYLAQQSPCVLVLDNSDLYEDDDLETTVFSEGLAFGKRTLCNVIVSVRDRTFVRHRTDASFDAFELRRFWLDPPPFREVLARRLTYSKAILRGQSARIETGRSLNLAVPDLGVFFDIVQRSVLSGAAGEYVESMADLNIRLGLSLITNFLTSGHIQADRVLKTFLTNNRHVSFPFHEVFKGTCLGQWKHFKEGRAECINVFDARLGATKLRLLRLFLLNFLVGRAHNEDSIEVPVNDCIRAFSHLGASEAQVVQVIAFLAKHRLVRTVTAEDVTPDSIVTISRSGGYYARVLPNRFSYVEECMLDTAIDGEEAWQELSELTLAVSAETNITRRMELRQKRITRFLAYLRNAEAESLSGIDGALQLQSMARIEAAVLAEAKDAVAAADRLYGEGPDRRNVSRAQPSRRGR